LKAINIYQKHQTCRATHKAGKINNVTKKIEKKSKTGRMVGTGSVVEVTAMMKKPHPTAEQLSPLQPPTTVCS